MEQLSTISPELTTTLWHVGGGTLAGIAVGYALKKATQAALLLLGLTLLLMFALSQAHVININWTALTTGIETSAQSAGQWATAAVKSLGTTMVGFGVGALVGLRLR